MTTTLHDQITEADKSFAEAFNTGDLDSLLTYHEDGALLKPPGANPARGDSGVATAAVKEMYEAGFRNMRHESIEFGSDGDLAYHVGRTVADAPGDEGMVTQAWTFLDIYKRDDEGQWKIHVSIWNDDESA